jgi:hypothetical protein
LRTICDVDLLDLFTRKCKKEKGNVKGKDIAKIVTTIFATTFDY